jgi:hypothetical protein
MGEGTSAAWTHARGNKTGRSDKRRRTRILELPPQAERALFEVAEETGQLAPVVLLTKYYLSPEQVVSCELSNGGLAVPGFELPLSVDPADREVLASWLSRRRRARSAQAIRNLLGDLREKVIARLEHEDRLAGRCVDWATLLDIGVVALRRMAAERHAEACGFEESVYRELLHDETADPHEVLHRLSRPARRILAGAAEAIVVEVVAARKRLEGAP